MNLQPRQCSAGTAALHPAQLHLIGYASLSPTQGLYSTAASRWPDLSQVDSRLPRHLSQEREPGGELCCPSQMALLQESRSLTSAMFC